MDEERKVSKQQRYHDRQAGRGLAKICVWVPDDSRHLLIEFAKYLRDHKKTPSGEG